VAVGRVGRPHGLDGSFHVTRPGELNADAVYVDGERHAVVRRAGTPEKPILRLAGSSSREDAEALRGRELTVPRETLTLEPGEFWAGDLEGLEVVDGERRVGVVSRMVALPSCEALEVGERLIPMVADAIRSIDLERGRVDVDLGFLGE
jgi:16S rRNA processing protein RimM